MCLHVAFLRNLIAFYLNCLTVCNVLDLAIFAFMSRLSLESIDVTWLSQISVDGWYSYDECKLRHKSALLDGGCHCVLFSTKSCYRSSQIPVFFSNYFACKLKRKGKTTLKYTYV